MTSVRPIKTDVTKTVRSNLYFIFFQNDVVDFNRIWNPKLYIENSLGDPKEQIRHRVIYNDKGEAFIYEKRVAKGTFMENLELDDFPFDVQVRILLSKM